MTTKHQKEQIEDVLLRSEEDCSECDNTGISNNEYYDILKTEDCFETENFVRGYN